MGTSASSSPTALRWYIALELGRLRRQAGLTLQQVAQRLGTSTSHVGHLEKGRNLPARAELEVLLDFYQLGDRIPSFAELLESARTGKDWWLSFEGVAPPWFDLFLGLESSAAQIESYDSHVIPGLFQTPAYNEAVIRAEDPDLTDSEIARRIELRQARQGVLTREPDPPSVWSILDESILYGAADSPSIMREQLEHLDKMTRLPNVNVLILRMSTRPHAGSNGTFKILSLPDLIGAPAVAYTDGMVHGTYYEDSDAVLRYRNALTRLHNMAVSPEESQKWIRRRAEELK
ncbi:helix-turn-helix transcriptional regulator [Pseudonocardia eucalypti]|uniref:Helix-turn-helix transcriptional regulator n=1 Tax=Pseudonocardia eucalypti TaxID=648755 RepID=A0ABP9Q3R5_9PSEU|nr:transcriptional regulator with XRE-family HTH domain [Pseudonocardia eucalypti]